MALKKCKERKRERKGGRKEERRNRILKTFYKDSSDLKKKS